VGWVIVYDKYKIISEDSEKFMPKLTQKCLTK